MSPTHHESTQGAMRAFRGVVVGLLTVAIGITGHVASDGIAPGVCPTIAMVVAMSWAVWRLAEQRWSTGSMFVAFLLAQLGVHGVAVIDHPTAETSTWLLLGFHVVGAMLLVALTRHGEAALWSVVEHLGLRAARALRVSAVTVSGALAISSPAPLLSGAGWSARPSRAPPVF